MTDDIRAAAARLRRYYAGELVYLGPDGDAAFTGDVLALLDAVDPPSPAEPLSDEAFGRAWAGQQGWGEPQSAWIGDIRLLGWSMSAGHPPVRATGFCGAVMGEAGHAYEALGRAVRAVHAAVPPLRGGA